MNWKIEDLKRSFELVYIYISYDTEALSLGYKLVLCYEFLVGKI
jgi:hypothetical protein